MSKTYSAGIVTAYGAAKRAGYQGTYEDFCRQQAGYAESTAAVEVAKNTAVSAASTATAKAGEAATAATAAQTAKTQTEALATTASTKASEASASATSAGQSATNAAASATSAANAASAALGVLNSIPEDYSDLSENVDQLKADLTAKEYHYFIWHDGYFINSSGAVSENSARTYSDLILCPAGTICKYIGDTANTSINGISFYDKRGVYISGIANNGTLGTECTVTAPAGSWYCRITTRITMKDTTYLKLDNSVIGNTFVNLTEYIDVDAKYDIYKATATAESLMTESGTINSNGNPVANNDYLRSDYIPIKAGDVIHYSIAQYLTLCAFAVYDTSKAFTSGVVGVGTTSLVTGVFTAAADGFVRVSCYKTSLSMCKVYFGGSFVEELESLSVGPTFYCGANRTLMTLKAGLEAATQYMNATLYVDSGTYDLMTEFGSAWFEALDGTKTLVGLQLKNRVHVIFSPNSKVVSHYTGDNEYAQSLYSPFNAGEYGFTLENLTLECSRCRYAIHDERNGGTEIYKSHYINCNVYIDNSENDYWSSRCGIGGGLGANAEVIIENCVWGSDNPDSSNARNAVYYHLSNSTTNANHRAFVTIKANYFKTGCIQLDPGRLTTTAENSTFIITNNSFEKVYTGADEQGVFYASLDLTTNDLYEWNNNIRTS